jgi:biotin carboxyl carrier protein
MWSLRTPALLASIGLSCACAPAAQALANQPGGVRAPSQAQAGGSEFGVLAARPTTAHPVVARLSVPADSDPGPPPRVVVQIDEPGVASVQARVEIHNLATRRLVLLAPLGWVPTGRAVAVRWPAGARLPGGTYHVAVVARDPHGASLARTSRASGVATLTVRTIPPPAPKPAPTPVPAVPVEPPAPESVAAAPTPAQTLADGAVFPVAGPHSFGGPENRFGAAREGHVHQGQDVLTAEGTPVLAPLPGTIASASYQAAGAGYYLVEHTGYGLDFMFAHCMAGSFAVAEGARVSAGQQLCRAGQTGDATAPHLHFEMWVGGWQAPGGSPIDPLPYLEAWERG